ncbi:Lrp/AsnC family transcriptional regulator [Alteromonas sediminis]|uniref:Lrp/AsnC family transcriptional regulator n=1 Tax=Alteromonas sediminis TaxID=2259342 RepID=A0A3N5ZA21_9ALTE|nr:Lrp/AsnC family transcriptional regulator [Alteromonas sediminis]RPJ67864.1 Lrp/AsnC family transcriptional regulator [Alteromonas sediminis]
MARKLDTADLAILAALYSDPQTSNKAIAEAVGIAPSSCLERTRRLKVDGVIKGFYAQLNLTPLGGHIQAMVAVRLASHDRNTFKDFQSALLNSAEVLQLFHTGGENDVLLHVTVSDAPHLRDFVFDQITSRNDVTHVETSLIYDHKISNQLPHFENS